MSGRFTPMPNTDIGEFRLWIPVTVPRERQFRVHLGLRGWSWKLTGFEVPQELQERLARELMKQQGKDPSPALARFEALTAAPAPHPRPCFDRSAHSRCQLLPALPARAGTYNDPFVFGMTPAQVEQLVRPR